MSGLTIGMLSIDEIVLEMKIKSGTADEKYAALKVLPVV
jgi:hypothetical protein